jgi:hypothetical protein
MTRTHAGYYALSIAIVLAIAVMLAGCEGDGPQNCPPPIGCAK